MKEDIKKLFQDKDFSELFKEGGVAFFMRIGGQILGFILTLIIANYFGAKGLGDYVLAIVVLRIFTLISKLGMDTFSIRFIAAFSKQNKWKSILFFRRKIIILLTFTSLLASLVMYFFAIDIANLIQARDEHIRLNAFFVLPMAFFMLHYQSLRGLKRIAEFSFFYRMSQAAFSIISIFILYSYFEKDDYGLHMNNIPVYAYLSSVFIVFILSLISFIYWFNKKKDLDTNEDLDKLGFGKILQISLPLMFAQSVQFIMAWTDKLMLGNMMSAEQVGVYFTAFKLSMFGSISLMAINSIASPKFAEIYAKNDLLELKKVVQQSTKIIFWSTLPLIIFFFIFPEFLLGIFGSEFKAGVTAFVYLSIGKLISAFSGSVGNLLQMTGRQVTFMNILFFGAIINVVLNLLLIPLYGINGAALASMISLSSWNLIMVYFAKREYGFYTFYMPIINKR